jgi:hypothetical protein
MLVFIVKYKSKIGYYAALVDFMLFKKKDRMFLKKIKYKRYKAGSLYNEGERFFKTKL